MNGIDSSKLEQLFLNNSEFRKLYDEHVLLNRTIDLYEKHTNVDADKALLIKKLKKLRLSGKDRMIQISKEFESE